MKGFVAYKLPNSNSIITKKGNATLYKFIAEISNLNGFVFHSFNSKQNYFINDLTDCQLSDFEIYHTKDINFCINKTDYLKSCTQLINFLTKSKLSKVVLSKLHRIDTTFKPTDLFLALNHHYKNTFNYIISIEGMGCWVGSTPEILLSLEDNHFKTVSIAGTKSLETTKWGEKEIEEQQIVTDYISQTLQPISTFSKSETKTIKAGNVFHLKTNFEGKLSTDSWVDMVTALHPTPATCGLPKKEAQHHIKKIEQHERKFYTGFLGPISKSESHFFVNLRCLEVQKSNSFLYLGGGITPHSIAKDEWVETEKKAETLLNIINSL